MTQFRTPTPKEINAFARCIRDCLNDQVEYIIWTNPRILVTEVDTPVLLHEGCRYNALHIAARNGNSPAAKIILQVIGSKKFMDTLYPDDDSDNKYWRTMYLTDLYLNAPDAILHETPLHFASKFGFPEVCEVFILHPQTKLDPLNKDGESPISMVASRVKEEKKKSNLVKEISRLFDCLFIVPIWRYTDGSHGTVGDVIQINDVPVSAWIHKSSKENFHNIDNSVSSFDAGKKISAYAGPMTEDEAKKFLSQMQKSANRKLVPAHPELSPISQIAEGFSRLTLRDSDMDEIEEYQSHESQNSKKKIQIRKAGSCSDVLGSRVIRDTNKLKKVTKNQINYPSSLAILRGEAKLTDHRFQPSFETLRDSVQRLEDPLKGLERVAYLRTREFGCKWKEYWCFLDKYIDMSSAEGLTEIEAYLSNVEKGLHERAQNQESHKCENSSKANDSIVESLKESKEDNSNGIRILCSASNVRDYSIEVFQDCETLDVFLNGKTVTIDDWFLQKAIQDTLESIPEEKRNKLYPCLSRWYDKLKSYGRIYKTGWAGAKPNKKIW